MLIKIPRCEIHSELGHGAHSVVYRATLDGVPCALKVLRKKSSFARWVYREAVALARIRDEALPRVLEVGEVDGKPYLAMELIEGETLAARLAAGALSERAALHITDCLLRALASVHARGLVHRDVKPRNVVLAKTGAIRLVDFGFVTPFERSSEIELAGTRGYAAPEQFHPNARIDGRADLHAVGVVLFECLTHERSASDTVLDSAAMSRLPPRVASLIAGMVAHDAEERYPDVATARADLQRVMADTDPLGVSFAPRGSLRAPMIGREQELNHIARMLGAARSGTGAVVLIDGPSGCGKTRLLEAAQNTWRDLDGATQVMVPSRDGDAPLAVLRKLFEGIAAGDGTPDGRRNGESALRTAAGRELAPMAALIAPSLGAVLGVADMEPSSASQAVFAEGAVELIVRLVRASGPLLIMIDDLQWTDPASRDVLLRLAHRIAEVPLALVFAARDEGRASPAFDRLLSLNRTRLEIVRPAPFTGREVGDFVRAYLGEDSIADATLGRIESLAGRVPLNILEILRTFLDHGVLRPSGGAWVFDQAKAETIALPRDAMAGLDRRLDELPPATRTVLDHAAVLGSTFDDSQLAEVLDLSLDDLAFALTDARRAALIEADQPGRHRFVHDSVRELLLRTIPESRLREVHQRAAEVLDRSATGSYESLGRIATHYAAGELERAPAAAARAARAAGVAALNRFDNEAALQFFALARKASKLDGASLPAEFDCHVGEAHLRLGALQESRRAFELALDATTDRVERARILERIAWVHQAGSNADEAWAALEQAFAALDTHLPMEKPAAIASTIARAARWAAHRFRSAPAATDTSVIALLSDLNHQNARLGIAHGKPLRALQSSVLALELAQRLGPSVTQARALALMGLIQTSIGSATGGQATLAQAEAMASAIDDPVTVAFCVQVKALAACFAGQFEVALQELERFWGDHGHWVELTEYCLHAANADLIESLRGKPLDAWAWVQRAVDRVRRSDRIPVVFNDYLVHRVRADLDALGRHADPLDPWLSRELDASLDREPPVGSAHRLGSWGPRARALLESSRLGPELDELVASFEKEGTNPRFAHPMLAEYYIAIAHARVEQVLAGKEEGRRDLRRALADLQASARLPLFKAHRLLIEAWSAWFEGSVGNARKLSARAESLAEEESCPWVMSGAARLRAHILRAEGHAASALDQARVSIMLSVEHGAGPRAALVRREFALAEPTAQRASLASTSRTSHLSHSKKQLAALLGVVRASARDLRPEPQAIAILDELLGALDASRATIWFQPDLARKGKLVVSRSRDGKTWYGVDGFREVLLRQLIENGPVDPVPLSSAQNMLAVPFSLYGNAVGALCIEREVGPAFTSDSRELLEVLLHQVPVALEVAGLLSERERLQTSLQRAQKMEAVGRLAGGVAHDFNNMLAAMSGSLETVSRHATEKTRFSIDIIQQSVERATRMTKQLLTFSRHSPFKPGACSVGQVVLGIEAMLTTVVGKLVTLEIALADESDLVRADSAALEQALVNLAVNARDAMPEGGTLVISTVLEEVGEASPGLAPGRYVAIVVRDTGEGMSDETLERVFEPFFTTKAEGVGTGLGLTTVYAFAKGVGGHIDVTSELGKGTTFRIYIPALAARQPSESAAPASAEPPLSTAARSATLPVRRGILIVDDESVIRSYLATFLTEAGYRVFLAKNGDEALDAAERHGREIGLAIVDVRMPGMSGPALVKRLRERQLMFRVLFMTGFSPEPLGVEGDEPVEVLEKPFSSERLMERIDAAFSESLTNRTAG